MLRLEDYKDKEALESLISWEKFVLAKRIVSCAFIFINILGPAINFKKIGENFYPNFITAVTYTWGGVWGVVMLTQVVRYLFGITRKKKRAPK